MITTENPRTHCPSLLYRTVCCDHRMITRRLLLNGQERHIQQFQHLNGQERHIQHLQPLHHQNSSLSASRSAAILRSRISSWRHSGSKYLHSSYNRRYSFRSSSLRDFLTSRHPLCSCNTFRMNKASSSSRCFRNASQNAPLSRSSVSNIRASPSGCCVRFSDRFRLACDRECREHLSASQPAAFQAVLSIPAGSWFVYSMARSARDPTHDSGQESHTVDKHQLQVWNRRLYHSCSDTIIPLWTETHVFLTCETNIIRKHKNRSNDIWMRCDLKSTWMLHELRQKMPAKRSCSSNTSVEAWWPCRFRGPSDPVESKPCIAIICQNRNRHVTELHDLLPRTGHSTNAMKTKDKGHSHFPQQLLRHLHSLMFESCFQIMFEEKTPNHWNEKENNPCIYISHWDPLTHGTTGEIHLTTRTAVPQRRMLE